MGAWKPAALAIVLALALQPALPGAAGKGASDPEILDAQGDQQVPGSNAGLPSVPLGVGPIQPEPTAGEMDVLAAWFDDPDPEHMTFDPVSRNGTAFHATLSLREIRGGSDACTTCLWAILWEHRGRTYAAYALREADSLTFFSERFALGFATGDEAEPGSGAFPFTEIGPLDGHIEASAPGRVTFEVPWKMLGGANPGDRLHSTRALAMLRAQGFPSEPSQEPTWHIADRGPDCEPSEDSPPHCTNHGHSFRLFESWFQAPPPPADFGNPSRQALVENPGDTDAQSGIPGGAPEGPGIALPAGALPLIFVGGLAAAGASAYAVTRSRPQGKLAARVREARRLYREQPQAGLRELERIQADTQDAFRRGWISGAGLGRLQARIASARSAFDPHATSGASQLASAPGSQATVAGAALPPFAASQGSSQGGAPAASPSMSRYRFQAPLPLGSFGQAYVAEDTRLQRKVVVKQLHPHWRMDPKVRAGFLREARIAGQLNHPHIVTVYDIDTSGPDSIIMEYVEGGSLEERLRKGPLPPGEALRVADEVLRGLERVHAEGIFHRDLKPANILITREGRAKIADFGIAHAPTDAQAVRFSASGHQPGTPLYMAPEQVLNEPPDARTDLYALCAMLHEMLAGAHYLGGHWQRDFELRKAIVEQAPVIDPRIPAPLAAVLRRGLAKDRAQRPAGAAALRRALADARRELGLPAPEAS